MKEICLKAPGIELKTERAREAIIFATSLIDAMYYGEDDAIDSLSIYKDDMLVVEIFCGEIDGSRYVSIFGKHHCLPDAKDIMGNKICEWLS